jgi:hypothetical protein
MPCQLVPLKLCAHYMIGRVLQACRRLVPHPPPKQAKCSGAACQLPAGSLAEDAITSRARAGNRCSSDHAVAKLRWVLCMHRGLTPSMAKPAAVPTKRQSHTH